MLMSIAPLFTERSCTGARNSGSNKTWTLPSSPQPDLCALLNGRSGSSLLCHCFLERDLNRSVLQLWELVIWVVLSVPLFNILSLASAYYILLDPGDAECLCLASGEQRQQVDNSNSVVSIVRQRQAVLWVRGACGPCRKFPLSASLKGWVD